jgi:AcrR family transcriptional regulator
MAPPGSEKSSDPERRAQILDCAEKLLSHYGPAKTTIGDIAREAGIGIGSVYLEFSSKDEIIGELAGRRHGRVLAAMRAAASRGTYADRLTHALEARIQVFFELATQGMHACDLVFCKSAPVKNAYGRFREDELAFVAELLRDGTRAGELEVKQPKRTAELIQRAYVSFSPPWLFEHDRREAMAWVRSLNELLLAGMLRR